MSNVGIALFFVTRHSNFGTVIQLRNAAHRSQHTHGHLVFIEIALVDFVEAVGVVVFGKYQ